MSPEEIGNCSKGGVHSLGGSGSGAENVILPRRGFHRVLWRGLWRSQARISNISGSMLMQAYIQALDFSIGSF